MKNLNKIILISTAAIAAASLSFCHKGHGHHHAQGGERPAELSLPADIREVFKGEMRLIQDGILTVKDAIKNRDAKLGEETALKIKDSFILNQKLTPEQFETLDKSLPADFVELDKSFHALAGELAARFARKDFSGASEVEQKMHQSCMVCHGRYMK